jgi:hypothetical protein
VGTDPVTDEAATPDVPDRRGRRGDPPARVAKISTAGMSGAFVLGLVAVMGWSQRPIEAPAPTIPPAGPSTAVAATPTTTLAASATTVAAPPTTLAPLATTLPPAPPTTMAPAPPAAPPPTQPVIVVSEQSQ